MFMLHILGVIVTEKWNTDNQLATAIEVQDKVAKGSTVTLGGAYAPANGYVRSHYHVFLKKSKTSIFDKVVSNGKGRLVERVCPPNG
jgi:hypothetical protein